MAQRNVEKLRKCEQCTREIKCTAEQMRKHVVEECPAKPKKWGVKK